MGTDPESVGADGGDCMALHGWKGEEALSLCSGALGGVVRCVVLFCDGRPGSASAGEVSTISMVRSLQDLCKAFLCNLSGRPGPARLQAGMN